VIRALAVGDDGQPLIMLGLDPQNLNRLREGQPIRVNLRRLHPGGPDTVLPDINVVVFFAGTDEIRALREATSR
jgi:hypothetical protein